MAGTAAKRGVVIGAAVVGLVGLAVAVCYGLWWAPGPTPRATNPEAAASLPSKYAAAALPPRLRAETWDLGTTLPSTETIHSLDLPNNSDQTWTLKHLTSSCSCASAELSAKTIRPGETGREKVQG